MGVPPAFIDREWTNEKVMKMANDEIDPEKQTWKIKKISEVVSQKHIGLLGHVIRASENDPMKQVTFEYKSMRPLIPANRQVGRPREK